MSVKATVTITKSFDDGNEFTKEWKWGDLREFFRDEGLYLDRLAGVVEDEGVAGEGFTINYKVEAVKE